MTTPIRSDGTVDALQLELFPCDEDQAPPGGITLAMARASTPPGWWQYIDALYSGYTANDIVVHACREQDGEVVIHATSASGDTETIEYLVQRLHDAASRTCMCCGRGPARAYRLRVDQPTRVACDECRTRLQEGESLLQIADEFFQLDGRRRGAPRVRVVTVGASNPAMVTPAKRACTVLPPDELRRLIVELRDAMRADIVGHDEAIMRLALLGALHVGGGLPRGTRALILGPSGSGKSSLIASLRRALEAWDIAWVITDALDLTSSGWGGAPSIGDLIEAALHGAPADSPRAQHAIVVIDEIHHARVDPGATGNMRTKREEVFASLLGLAGYGTVHLGEGTTEWSSNSALVIGMGSFTGLLPTGPVTIRDITAAGIPVELATRLAQEIIVMHRLDEAALIELLRHWPELTSLIEVCRRLGYTVRVADEAYRRAARVVTLGHDDATARTAGAWVVAALRTALIHALTDPSVHELVISPDSLPIPPTATRPPQPPDDPPAGSGGWDATLILTPR